MAVTFNKRELSVLMAAVLYATANRDAMSDAMLGEDDQPTMRLGDDWHCTEIDECELEAMGDKLRGMFASVAKR